MALDATDWTIDRATKVIAYTGDDHTGAAPTYATVIELHRWLRDLQDDAEFTGDDELDIIDVDASERSTDNIITLKNGYELNAAAPEHLYDGSIIQGTVGVDQIIWDGIVNFGNAGVLIQLIQEGAVIADDFWNYSIGGSDDTSVSAAFLTDSTASWTTDELVGYTIYNVTDGSFGIITANTGTTVTATLEGGTENDWDSGDVYKIGKGLNSDAGGGISHRFMVKVHDFVADGGDIDLRKLIGTTRRWYKTYAEFTIPATSRGNNVLALSDSDDLNNTTAYDTVSTWTTITNTTEGFVQLDVNNDSTNEDYYSEWNRDTYTINQFYERMKFLTTDSSASTLYGLNGELFRGITHELDVDGGAGTWGTPEHEVISWGTGATAGTARLLAVDNKTGASTTKIWFQMLTGVTPGDNLTITGGTSSATALADLTTGSLTERPISTPFVGQSTGSALIGSYGLSLETGDLAVNDTVFDLTNTAYNPPNNVTFTVSGLVSGEDYVLVTNDNTGIDFTQMALATALTGATETTVDVGLGNIPQDTPASAGTTGGIRIERNDGLYSLHRYTAYDAGRQNFTIPSYNFSTNNASIANNVFISYIDRLANATSLNFQCVYNAPRTMFVRVRDGGTAGDTEGTKTYEGTGSLSSTGGGVSINRISDV